MKKATLVLVIICLAICGAVFAQDTTEVKVNPLQAEVDQLKARNTAIENAFISTYLKEQGKEAGKAFMDLYLYTNQLEVENQNMRQVVEVTQKMINEISEVKSIKGLDTVLKKYGIDRKKE